MAGRPFVTGTTAPTHEEASKVNSSIVGFDDIEPVEHYLGALDRTMSNAQDRAGGMGGTERMVVPKAMFEDGVAEYLLTRDERERVSGRAPKVSVLENNVDASGSVQDEEDSHDDVLDHTSHHPLTPSHSLHTSLKRPRSTSISSPTTSSSSSSHRSHQRLKHTNHDYDDDEVDLVEFLLLTLRRHFQGCCCCALR